MRHCLARLLCLLCLLARHSCRYFAPAAMRGVCDSLSRDGDKPDHRGKTYAEQYFPWWCKADWTAEEAGLTRAQAAKS